MSPKLCDICDKNTSPIQAFWIHAPSTALRGLPPDTPNSRTWLPKGSTVAKRHLPLGKLQMKAFKSSANQDTLRHPLLNSEHPHKEPKFSRHHLGAASTNKPIPSASTQLGACTRLYLQTWAMKKRKTTVLSSTAYPERSLGSTSSAVLTEMRPAHV